MSRAKRTVVLVLIVMLLGTSVNAVSFSDVDENSGYAESIMILSDIGVLNGYPDGTFRPDSTITRAEATAVVCRLLGGTYESPTQKTNVFSDVAQDFWGNSYIAQCVELGIVSGYGDGRFGPNDPVTYEQMVAMLIRAWGYDNHAHENGGWPNGYFAIAEDLEVTGGIILGKTDPAPRKIVAVLSYNIILQSPWVEE